MGREYHHTVASPRMSLGEREFALNDNNNLPLGVGYRSIDFNISFKPSGLQTIKDL